jgi:predicted TIM-barrel fold metal-dependent hydrolase
MPAMAYPKDVPIIDLMMGTHAGTAAKSQYDFMKRALRDEGSKGMNFPAQYMFKDVPYSDQARDPGGPLEVEPPQGADLLLPAMDKHNVERAMIGVSPKADLSPQLLRDHPDRFFGSYEIDPNRGMDCVREIVRMHEEWGIKAVTSFPAGTFPQVPINDRKMYPIYAKCVELDIPIFICAGVPGPRFPMMAQYVGHLDEVCYDFPDLRIVTRHGCEPWQALAVKLMLKWPNLHYSTSAFAPKHYPKEIIDYANTRGADKILYAGYFPMGLSLDRIFSDMENVPFKDAVWPKFLRENAVRVLKL